MTKITRRLLAFVALAGLFIFTGCGDDDEFVPTQTIMETLEADTGGNSGLDSLTKYLKANPDLVAMLSGTGPNTLFAPTNAAFQSLMATPGFPQNIEDIDPNIIKGVLAYHIVAGEEIRKAQITSGAAFNTAFTTVPPCDPASGTIQAIEVNSDGTLKTGSSNQNIEISEADILATNGVVHKVGSVLIPPSVGTSLTPILGTLAGTVLLGADFTHLKTLVNLADCGAQSGDPIISQLLASTNDGAGYTAFLIPNAVFEGAAEQNGITVEQFLGSFTASSARSTLLNHLVSGRYTVDASSNTTQFTDAMDITTLLNLNLSVTVTNPGAQTGPYGVVLTADASGRAAPIVVKDINHGNGIAQVIGGILAPQ